MKYAVMALSGGMDSTSLLLRLLRENNTVFTIGFDYGQKHVVELSRANKNIDYLASKSLDCLLYTSPSPRDISGSRMPSSA